MTKKNQIYLPAFIMYIIAALGTVIYNWTNDYWLVAVVSLIVTGFTLFTVFTNKEETMNSTMFDWISVCALAAFQVVLTICVSILHMPFVGFLRYFNYGVQIAGYILIGYAAVRFVLEYTSAIEKVRNYFKNRKANKSQKIENSNEEVANKVEEAISSEKVNEETTDTSDVEVIGTSQEEKEPEIIGIELKEEKEEPTPYMEEEL